MEARGKEISNFRKRSDCRLFLISLKAGGFGLNLTSANNVHMLDMWFNPSVEVSWSYHFVFGAFLSSLRVRLTFFVISYLLRLGGDRLKPSTGPIGLGKNAMLMSTTTR